MTADWGRRVGLVEKETVIELTGINPTWQTIHQIFKEAQQAGSNL